MNSSVDTRLRWHAVKVIDCKKETKRAVTLTLMPRDRSVSFAHEAGQYVNLMLDIQGESYCRSYSISGNTAEGGVMITVQAIDDGRVSRHINEHVAVGDTLHCSYPVGDFRLAESDREAVFFAAGSGITPVMAMLRQWLSTSDRPCALYYFTRSADDTIFINALADLAERYRQQFTLMHWFSSEQGRFSDVGSLEGAHAVFQQAPDVYLCGPPSWGQALQKTLQASDYAFGEIFQENYCASLIGSDEEPTQLADTQLSHTLHIRIGDNEYTSQAASGERILSVLRRDHIPLTSGCEMGKCGSCIATVVSGKVELNDTGFLHAEEVEDGLTLCCQARVIGDCSLEVE